MLEIENYSFRFKLTFSIPGYFSSYNPNLLTHISKNNIIQQTTIQNQNTKKIYFFFMIQKDLLLAPLI